MKATKDHISLETAKLLKDCDVESKYEWGCDGHHFCGEEEEYEENNYRVEEKWFFSRFPEKPLGPAYTWQEILWEYPDEFFGEWESPKDNHEYRILDLLQHKDYSQADLYFREHCILIK